MRRPREAKSQKGHAKPPDDRTAGLAHEVSFGRSAVSRTTLGVSMPAAHAAFPPLAEAGHGDVVKGHLGVDSEELPAFSAYPKAQFALFAGDDRRVESVDLPEGGCPE